MSAETTAGAARGGGDEARGVLYILVSALAYGSMPIVGKLAYAAGVATTTVLAWRFAVAVAIFAAIKRRGEARLPWRKRLTLWSLGLLFVGNAFMYFAALETVPAATAAVLIYTYPVMVLLLSALMGLEPFTVRGLAAALLAFAGCALTTGGLGGMLAHRGVVLVLASALVYACYVVLGGRFAADVPAEVASRHLVQGCAAVLVPWAALRGELALPASAPAWVPVLALGSLCTVVPIRAFLAGLQRIGPGRAAVLSSVEILVTIVLAVALLGESLGRRQAAGAVLILSAVLLHNLRALRRVV